MKYFAVRKKDTGNLCTFEYEAWAVWESLGKEFMVYPENHKILEYYRNESSLYEIVELEINFKN